MIHHDTVVYTCSNLKHVIIPICSASFPCKYFRAPHTTIQKTEAKAVCSPCLLTSNLSGSSKISSNCKLGITISLVQMNIETLHSHIPIVTDTDCNSYKPIFKTVIEEYKNHDNFCR